MRDEKGNSDATDPFDRGLETFFEKHRDAPPLSADFEAKLLAIAQSEPTPARAPVTFLIIILVLATGIVGAAVWTPYILVGAIGLVAVYEWVLRAAASRHRAAVSPVTSRAD